MKVSLNGRKIGLIGAICLGAGENSLALEETSGQPADREPCPNALNLDQTPRKSASVLESIWTQHRHQHLQAARRQVQRTSVCAPEPSLLNEMPQQLVSQLTRQVLTPVRPIEARISKTPF